MKQRHLLRAVGGPVHRGRWPPSCTTFNVLAAIYKRRGTEEVREKTAFWERSGSPRSKRDSALFWERKSSIICLQELWVRDSRSPVPQVRGPAFRRRGVQRVQAAAERTTAAMGC